MSKSGTVRGALPFELMMLNGMAGPDFELALSRQSSLGIRQLDLKDSIRGKAVENLDLEDIVWAADLIERSAMTVGCLSTSLGNSDTAMGEIEWRRRNSGVLDGVLMAAEKFRPHFIRVLAAYSNSSEPGYRLRNHLDRSPWLPKAYADLISKIIAAGYQPLIENEAERCIIADPDDALYLFEVAGLPEQTRFIWDVQNMWQMGHFPSVGSVGSLRPILGAVHLKGGIANSAGRLELASGLRQASWPVIEIVREAIVRNAVSSVCLNPSHGRRTPEYDVWTTACDDASFLRDNFKVGETH